MDYRKALGLTFAAAGLAFAQPAAATCMVQGESPAPGIRIELTSPSGKKKLIRTTDQAGLLVLRGLEKGEWQLKLAGPTPHKMVVGKDRRLKIRSVSVTVSCSPPGGPVSTSSSITLRKVN